VTWPSCLVSLMYSPDGTNVYDLRGEFEGMKNRVPIGGTSYSLDQTLFAVGPIGWDVSFSHNTRHHRQTQ